MELIIRKLLIFVCFSLISINHVHGQDADNIEQFRWSTLTYENLPKDPTYQIDGKNYYIPENNIPTGISPYRGEKLFVTVARLNHGIPSTLNYIDLRKYRSNKSPPLQAYPSYADNELHVS